MTGQPGVVYMLHFDHPRTYLNPHPKAVTRHA